MVLEEKMPDLLALLTAHIGGDALVVPIVPRPPTLGPSHISTADAPEKKRKRGKQTEGSEEGEITHYTEQPPAKEPRITWGQQKQVLLVELAKALKANCAPIPPYGTQPLC